MIFLFTQTISASYPNQKYNGLILGNCNLEELKTERIGYQFGRKRILFERENFYLVPDEQNVYEEGSYTLNNYIVEQGFNIINLSNKLYIYGTIGLGISPTIDLFEGFWDLRSTLGIRFELTKNISFYGEKLFRKQITFDTQRINNNSIWFGINLSYSTLINNTKNKNNSNNITKEKIEYKRIEEKSKNTRYIKVIDMVEIYDKPTNEGSYVAMAKEDDVFELIEELNGWYKISMFSGEYRYLQKKNAEIVDYDIKIPKSRSLRKEIFLKLYKVEGDALSKADERFPNDIDENIKYERKLVDRYKLRIFQSYKIQAPAYHYIIVEGSEEQWAY